MKKPDTNPPNSGESLTVVPDRESRAVPRTRRIAPGTLTRYALILGVAMIAAAWLWSLAFQGHGLSAQFPRDQWPAELLTGALAGGMFALAALTLLDRVPSLKRIERLLTAWLDMPALRVHHAIIFGLLAGIPEEILFRGALQPVLGLVITSIIFGALHAITWAYFVYATVAGVLLGVLAAGTGGLWAPVAAHTVIDVIMFLMLMCTWRRSHTVPSA